MHFTSTGLKFAVFVSLFCHIFCFSSIELTFGNKASGKSSEFSKIFFLGSILQEADYYLQSARESDYSVSGLDNIDMLNPLEKSIIVRDFLRGLRLKSLPIYDLGYDFKKPPLVNLNDNKIAYFEPSAALKTKQAESSIMFYPTMPYHFLLYFKDRQTAHVEVAFYVSSKGKVLGLKRKISSGNPEVDLLIMRNLTHYLNLCKSNFALGTSRTVKIDLSP